MLHTPAGRTGLGAQRIPAPTREDYLASESLSNLSDYLMRYYGKKVILLLDEYDTPMHEAYVGGYWDELVSFIRNLFNSTFKTNPYLERALMTGITRVSKESIFSDLNNLEVVTTTSEKYEDSFGFTQEEVWEALKEYGLYGQREQVRDWYDGFSFGKKTVQKRSRLWRMPQRRLWNRSTGCIMPRIWKRKGSRRSGSGSMDLHLKEKRF